VTVRQWDSGLLEAARQGDVAAVERLLALCRPDLRRYASRTCRTAEDAEDAVQESLILIYRKVAALRSTAALARWLFQIVRRQCLRRVLRQGHADTAIVAEETYLATHSDIDLRLDMAAAVQSLPAIYREVIVLRDFEELTIQEIADRLGLIPETVKTRIYRGRQLVREHLLA